ncbi:hypothetical protein [Bathycoccus sp. RCC716 virus 1]|uniref:Uncharacterized protein n=1 Tax=Bathycoccus sp. RCC716 virus 1 TaxID=2530038 RepID=A0A7S6SXD3_9PHYC|nr:hypothetical protein [Bathycoccus sp. RCC716 virus 1]
MDPKVILFTLVTIIIISALLHYFVFKKSEEPKPEVDFEEEVEEVEEPSPDAVDEVMTGGDDEPVPDEDETSLETAPADGETVDQNDVVEGYTLKK